MNNSAKIQPIQLKFGLLLVRVRRFCLKKELLNLVIRLPRYGSAKTTPGFFETQAWTRPHDDIPHLELVLNRIFIVSAELRLFEKRII